jgi:catechol 2,3-dioxygenase-like lactoylglutathione lyase family enzyme
MKLGHIEIFVTDSAKSKMFYNEVLGFETIEVQHEKFVWLKLNDNVILLRPGKNELHVNEYKNTNSAIVFYTNDLNKTKQKLISKGLVFSGTDGSDRCLTFTDPDGNWFQLVNPDEH